MEQELNQLELKTRKSETSLAIVEMLKTLSWHLADKPFVFCKIYWNKETQVVYVDAAGLPEPQRNGVSNLVLKATTNTYEYWFDV
jgi:hypothetical protein